MVPLLYFSERLDWLAARLAEKVRENQDIFRRRVILIPHMGMKGWLMRRIASEMPSEQLVGLEFLTWRELISSPPHRLEVILRLLSEELPEQGSVHAAETLASLFEEYWFYGEPKDAVQNRLYKMFYSLPVVRDGIFFDEVHLFGIDEMPPAIWDWLFRTKKQFTGYLFSPSAQYWGDVNSDRERRFERRKRKSQEGMDERMPLLGNWGKLGRRTLALLDRFEWIGDEGYHPETGTALADLKRDMLLLEKGERAQDRSLEVRGVGASRIEELEEVRRQILEWEGSLSDVLVVAPQIDPYLPLLPVVFGDEIPWSVRSEPLRSSYTDGMRLLLELSEGRWDAAVVLELVETKCFREAAGFTIEECETIREWIEEVRVRWGYEASTRPQGRGSWEQGLERLANTLLFVSPQEEKSVRVQGALLERLIGLLDQLREAVSSKGSLAAKEWALKWETLFATYLKAEEEIDLQAERKVFELLRVLKRETVTSLVVPFLPIRNALRRVQSVGSIRGNELEAVRFASLTDGAIVPCQLLIWIGMEEEIFPTREVPSSLDQLKGMRIARSERERYLLLKSLFQTESKLLITYRAISDEDGKETPPALPVQELEVPIVRNTPKQRRSFSKPLQWHLFDLPNEALPEGHHQISLQELKQFAKSPWGYHLEKELGIRWEQEESAQERWDDFSLSPLDNWRLQQIAIQKGSLPAHLLPIGLFGKIAQEHFRDVKPIEGLRREPISLEVELSSECTVSLRGMLSPITDQGFLLYGKGDLPRIVAIWPLFLIYRQVEGTQNKFLLPVEGKEKQLPDFDASEGLRKYLSFFLRMRGRISPLTRRWILPILNGQSEKETDSVYEWVAARASLPPVAEVRAVWEPIARSLFSPLLKEGRHATV